MSKFKIGDKVKILKKNDSYSALWVRSMDCTQETEGIVIGLKLQSVEFSPAYDVQVYNGTSWWYEEDWLEKVEENSVKQPATWNNIEIGDLVQYGVYGSCATVLSLAEDRVVIDLGGRYVLHKDIVAIYKKSWEKPKALEDMSKEELINLVKELKGEVR